MYWAAAALHIFMPTDGISLVAWEHGKVISQHVRAPQLFLNSNNTQVAAFLKKRHKNHYLLWNLSAGANYDFSKFGSQVCLRVGRLATALHNATPSQRFVW